MVAKDITSTEAAARVGIGRRSATLGLAGALAGLTGAVSAAAKDKGKIKKAKKKKPKKTPAGLVRRFDYREESFVVAPDTSIQAPVDCREGSANERAVAISGGYLNTYSEVQVQRSGPNVTNLARWVVTFRNNDSDADKLVFVYVRCAYLTK